MFSFAPGFPRCPWIWVWPWILKQSNVLELFLKMSLRPQKVWNLAQTSNRSRLKVEGNCGNVYCCQKKWLLLKCNILIDCGSGALNYWWKSIELCYTVSAVTLRWCYVINRTWLIMKLFHSWDVMMKSFGSKCRWRESTQCVLNISYHLSKHQLFIVWSAQSDLVVLALGIHPWYFWW